MLHFFAKRLKELQERDERGFTLIELLIVIIILGILAAIAIPVFLAQREKADLAACQSDTRNAAEAATLYAADNNGSFTGMTADEARTQGWNQTTGVLTTFTPQNAGADIDISSACPAGAPSPVIFSTSGDDAGKVVTPDPAP